MPTNREVTPVRSLCVNLYIRFTTARNNSVLLRQHVGALLGGLCSLEFYWLQCSSVVNIAGELYCEFSSYILLRSVILRVIGCSTPSGLLLLLLVCFTVSSTEGLTATCAAAFKLSSVKIVPSSSKQLVKL